MVVHKAENTNKFSHSSESDSQNVTSHTTDSLYDGTLDTEFQQPYVDIDEWRDQPVHHRYIHGGFKGTNTRFSFYFPHEESYEKRFFQFLAPIFRAAKTRRKAMLVQKAKSVSPFPAAPIL